MDLIFIENPSLLLYFGGVVILHILSFAVRKEKAVFVFDTANIALHAALTTAIFMNGGDLYDALVTVLLSALLALLRCKKPSGEDKNI
ncbi:MAG: hypothetical protein IKV97_06485 [Clostridia bacterium]|nr:hypothetical protein [Clostridia bacterium]